MKGTYIVKDRYKISYSYWAFYVDGITRLECGPCEFIKHISKGRKCQVAIHRYNDNDGGGQIGRFVWEKYFNKKEESNLPKQERNFYKE